MNLSFSDQHINHISHGNTDVEPLEEFLLERLLSTSSSATAAAVHDDDESSMSIHDMMSPSSHHRDTCESLPDLNDIFEVAPSHFPESLFLGEACRHGYPLETDDTAFSYPSTQVTRPKMLHTANNRKAHHHRSNTTILQAVITNHNTAEAYVDREPTKATTATR